VREVDRQGHRHSTLRLSRRTVRVNASASLAIWLEKAPPHVDAGSTPAATRRSRALGSAENASDSRCNVRTMLSGVPAGASKPYQTSPRTPCTPLSSSVGVSGSSCVRRPDATASATNLPDLMWGRTEPTVAKNESTSPDRSAVDAGAAPL